MRESARRRSLPSDRCARGDETERGQQSMCLQTGTAHMPGDATIRSEPPARSLAWPLRAPPNDASLLKTRVLGALAELAGLRTLRLCPSYVPANANLQFLSACVPGGSWRCMSSRSTLTVRGWAGCVCVQSRASCELPGTMPGTMRAKARLTQTRRCFGVSPRTPPTLIIMQEYP